MTIIGDLENTLPEPLSAAIASNTGVCQASKLGFVVEQTCAHATRHNCLYGYCLWCEFKMKPLTNPILLPDGWPKWGL